MDIINDLLGIVTGVTSNLWPKPAEKPHLVNGKLRPCPGTPNCVCSESDKPMEQIDPLFFKGSPEKAWEVLNRVVREHGGTVQDDQNGYLWSTFPVAVLGFIDDVEFRLDAASSLIHVRSSSRLGISDLGVNRGRVEQLRTAFNQGNG
jgi:uncharacterized protein (DUF1499 family)